MHYTRGFTIVELLIVIVVIGILAAITMAAYTGAQDRANDAAVQSDLKLTGKQLAIQQSRAGGVFPSNTDAALNPVEIKVTKNSHRQTSSNFLYCRSADFLQYAVLSISKSGKIYSEMNGDIALYTAATSLNDYATICTNLVGSNSARYGFTVADGWRSWVR